MNTKLSVGSISKPWKVNDSYICTRDGWSNQSFNICGRKTHFCNKITISSMVWSYILAWTTMLHLVDHTLVKGCNDYVIFWCAIILYTCSFSIGLKYSKLREWEQKSKVSVWFKSPIKLWGIYRRNCK